MNILKIINQLLLNKNIKFKYIKKPYKYIIYIYIYMEQKQIINKILEIENEDNISIKYKNITKLHNMIDKEEKKLEKLLEKIERVEESKYDNMELEQILSKFEKSDNIEKKVKYYHSISNKIDNIINVINN